VIYENKPGEKQNYGRITGFGRYYKKGNICRLNMVSKLLKICRRMGQQLQRLPFSSRDTGDIVAKAAQRSAGMAPRWNIG
jgi:hypothetical protein